MFVEQSYTFFLDDIQCKHISFYHYSFSTTLSTLPKQAPITDKPDLFANSLTKVVVPTDFCLVNICPIHKRGDPGDHTASLTSIICKLFLRILQQAPSIMKHAQFHLVNMVSYPVGPVSQICWSSRKR